MNTIRKDKFQKVTDAIRSLYEFLNQNDYEIDNIIKSSSLGTLQKVKMYCHDARIRSETFPGMASCNPSWHMIFQLYIAKYYRENVSVTDVAVMINTPVTTTLRHIDNQVENGFIRRVDDDEDRRRIWLVLTPKGEELVEKCMSKSSDIRMSREN